MSIDALPSSGAARPFTEAPEPDHPILGAELEALLDRHTLTRARRGNAIELLPSGVQSYERRWQLLESATRSVDLVALSMMKDGTTRRMCDLLLRKLRAGVRVRVIVDDAVAWTTGVGPWLRELAKAGAGVLRYDRVFHDVFPIRLKIKRRFHEKYTVIDGSAAILGGMNWGDKYATGGLVPSGWRDTDVCLRGPVVDDLQRQFNHDFDLYTAYLRGPAVTDPAIPAQTEPAPGGMAGVTCVRYLPHKPYDEQKLRMTEAVLLLLRNARSTVDWGCHGVRPPRLIAETLAEAAARGVQVRLITNSRQSSRGLMFYGLLGWMYRESSRHFPWLLGHGIRVFEWQRPGPFHSKNLAIDDVVACVGSYNIAPGSTFHHTESSVMITGGDFPAQVRRQFEIDLQDCREVTRDSLRPVPPREQPMLRLLDQRNLLVPRELRTDAVNRDLDAGRFKESAAAI